MLKYGANLNPLNTKPEVQCSSVVILWKINVIPNSNHMRWVKCVLSEDSGM